MILFSSYLQTLAAEPSLYSLLHLCVQQKIWLTRDDLYEQHVHPLIDAYIRDEQNALLYDSVGYFTAETPKQRRQNDNVQGLEIFLNLFFLQLYFPHIQLCCFVPALIRSCMIGS
jgi:hypothetical protein